MPREYVCRVVLSDDHIDAEYTAAHEKKLFTDFELSFIEFIEVATGEEGCSVSYEVRDL